MMRQGGRMRRLPAKPRRADRTVEKGEPPRNPKSQSGRHPLAAPDSAGFRAGFARKLLILLARKSRFAIEMYSELAQFFKAFLRVWMESPAAKRDSPIR
jgi:hypothetical protein